LLNNRDESRGGLEIFLLKFTLCAHYGRCIDPSWAQSCKKQTNFHIKWDCTSRWESTRSHFLKIDKFHRKFDMFDEFKLIFLLFHVDSIIIYIKTWKSTKDSWNFCFLASLFVNQVMKFSPSVDFGGFLDQDFDIQSSFGVLKVQVESSDVAIACKKWWFSAQSSKSLGKVQIYQQKIFFASTHGGKKALFLLKTLELLNRPSDVGEPFWWNVGY
jgi:hypothetical protein